MNLSRASAYAQRVTEGHTARDVDTLAGGDEASAKVCVLLTGVHADRLQRPAAIAGPEHEHISADRIGALPLGQLEIAIAARGGHAPERATCAKAQLNRQ